jgi:FkbM family methyltransferase
MRKVITVRGHTFLAQPLGPASVVVDLGANRGEFSQEIVGRFGCTSYAVEASPETSRTIPASDRLKVFNFAVNDRDAPVQFNVSSNPETSSLHPSNLPPGAQTGTVQVQGRTLASFVSEHGVDHIDLLKVDIEGAEVQLFGAATPEDLLRRIDQITIEFHDFTGAMTRGDVDSIVSRLRAAGFAAVRFSNSNMDWLFYRPDRLSVGPLARIWIRFITRNWRFFKRNLFGSRG